MKALLRYYRNFAALVRAPYAFNRSYGGGGISYDNIILPYYLSSKTIALLGQPFTQYGSPPLAAQSSHLFIVPLSVGVSAP
jgi:hypothetical protein